MKAGTRWAVALVATSMAGVAAPEGAGAGGVADGRPITVVELETPAGFTTPFPLEINNRGQVLARDQVSSLATKGVLWDRGDTAGTLIAPSPTPSEHVGPTDLNDRGLVVGNFGAAVPFCIADPSLPPRRLAFSWRDGVGTTLDPGTGTCLSSASHVNNRGDVLGFWDVPGFESQVVVWRGSEVLVPPLPPQPPLTLWGAAGINDRGQVLLTSSVFFSGVTTAWVWQIGGGVTQLGTLGGATAYPAAINEQGQVVGTSDTADGESHAALWDGGEVVDLGTLGGTASYAYDINERGQVFGQGETAAGRTHSFFWADGELTDLGTLGDTDIALARAMNDRGQVVGNSSNRAFLWEDGELTDLGTLTPDASSGALDINNRGQVVGTVNRPGASRVAIWHVDRAP